MRVDPGAVGIRRQRLACHAARNMLARKLGNEAAQIDADQIEWQAIDRRLKSAALLPTPPRTTSS